ncbi:MAG: hypothetical protein KC561_00225 [Myxococcales bacterium]|nr:hypothetical protein [Myxococcales bacterium]
MRMRVPQINRSLARWTSVAAVLAVMSTASSAVADDNDLVLRRFGECDFVTTGGTEQCVGVTADEESFRNLSRDLGYIFSPKGLSPGETIGEVGFELSYELNLNVIDSDADYWQTAVEDRDPDPVMVVSQIHVTKGLPFSFEVGAVLSHLFGSEMWALGGEVSWAIHEDYFYPVPNLGVRGFVNNVLGSSDINLTTAGFDLVADWPVGINGVASFTPYIGYNMTAVFASSRLLDATPEDGTPPIEGTGNQQSSKPEFVFDNENNVYHRWLAGFRVRFVMVNTSFEAIIADEVQTYSLKLGLDF